MSTETRESACQDTSGHGSSETPRCRASRHQPRAAKPEVAGCFRRKVHIGSIAVNTSKTCSPPDHVGRAPHAWPLSSILLYRSTAPHISRSYRSPISPHDFPICDRETSLRAWLGDCVLHATPIPPPLESTSTAFRSMPRSPAPPCVRLGASLLTGGQQTSCVPSMLLPCSLYQSAQLQPPDR